MTQRRLTIEGSQAYLACDIDGDLGGFGHAFDSVFAAVFLPKHSDKEALVLLIETILKAQSDSGK